MLENLHNIHTPFSSLPKCWITYTTINPAPAYQHAGEPTQRIKTLLQSTNILDNLHNMYKTFSSRPTCWKTYTTYIHPLLQSTNMLENLHNIYQPCSSLPTCWRTYTTYKPSPVYQHAGKL